ncbi:hypothetical protein, partial [Pseudomonas aeruginosa]|uniref:hypothetical protein n=1 Tax=Pseudomonas aeruginosa TaxID=287 RepID=UPI001C6494CE
PSKQILYLQLGNGIAPCTMKSVTFTNRADDMRDELKQLQAKVEAQSFVIEELLGICVESGLTSAAIAGSWKSVRNSP